MNKLEQIQKLKDEAVEEILNNPNLSKHEKLTEISESKLWEYKRWIQHIFAAQEKEFGEQVKEATGRTWAIIDDFICGSDGYPQRHEDVDMSQVIESLIDNAEFEETDKVTVLTNRSNKMVYEMKLDEVIDVIYNWCVENKAIGFNFDW